MRGYYALEDGPSLEIDNKHNVWERGLLGESEARLLS